MAVADNWGFIAFELMLPFNGRFCIFFFQILKAVVVVYELEIVILATHPAEQLGLFEVFYVFSIHFSIHCGAPLFVGLQVNQPYFMISTVPYHNLFRTDNLDKNRSQTFTFHFLPEQSLSVTVSVEKNNNTLFPLSTIAIALLSLLLLHQKCESVVMGSERKGNI